MTIERVNPESLSPPLGFSHAVTMTGGRLVFLAGQTAQGEDGSIEGDGLVAQFARALSNLLAALSAVGGGPEHVAKMTIYCTDPEDYATHRRALGAAWRERMGRDYPAMTLVGVTRLFDPAALVELDAFAVVPEPET